MNPSAHIHRVGVEQVRPLRHAVLRAGRPADESIYPQDSEPDTMHLAAFDDDGRLAACGTFFPESCDGRPAWRLRGMVSAPQVRGRGFAGALLAEGIARLRADGVRLLWCNARTPALAFYRSFGFVTMGEEFAVAGVPHYRAELELTGSADVPENGIST